ncbi:response regulator transcription factor [Sanyastnella coralliicola]|uniref:response regulator transcription factor n=1 Tax=Sanyastnella coralliicola TaxID=3069118 RepID=UPI0027B8878D|nr:response regulator transcription factor [Longitalea sp. SCSIO 12813]
MDQIRIAIADDHDLIRNGIAKLVEEYNCEVIFQATNGQDLIDQLANQSVDVVLMDINMPEKDGIKATQEISDNYPNIKVVALTALEDETNTIRMLRAGARAYLLKSSSSEELNRAIRDVFERGYHFSELVSGRLIQNLNKNHESQETSIALELSEREIEFVQYLCTEMTNKEIADKMHVSPRTSEGWRKSLCDKFGVSTRVGIVLFAFRNNLTS